MSDSVKESIALTGGLTPAEVAADCPGLQPTAAACALVHCEAMEIHRWRVKHSAADDIGPLLALMPHWDGTAMRQEVLSSELRDSNASLLGDGTASRQETLVWLSALQVIHACCKKYGSLEAIPRRPVHIPLSLFQPGKLLAA
jgi:hypothetical protein